MSFRNIGGDLHAMLSEWLENPESRRVVLQHTWDRCVGEAVSQHCRVRHFEDGVLTVDVTDTSWAPQLEGMSGELVAKINASLAKSWVRRIEWVDPDAAERDGSPEPADVGNS